MRSNDSSIPPTPYTRSDKVPLSPGHLQKPLACFQDQHHHVPPLQFDDELGPLGLVKTLPPPQQVRSVSRKHLAPQGSISHGQPFEQMMLRSLSLPAFQRLRSFSRQKSDVFVIRSLSINGMQGCKDNVSSFDIHSDEKEVPEDEAVCRICMLELEEGKETLKMECSCKGELALAHKECAIKWFSIKGNNQCDICSATVCNLPVLLFRRASSLLRGSSVTMAEEGMEESRSWREAALLLFSSVFASMWHKLEELSEFP